MRRLGPERWLATIGAVAAVAILALSPSAATAQDDGNPLRFLRPWLDRQLRGADPAVEAAPEDASPDDTSPATSPEDASPATSPDDTSPAISPDDTSPGTSPAEDEAGASPQGGERGRSGIEERETTPSAEAADAPASYQTGGPGSGDAPPGEASSDDASAAGTARPDAAPDPAGDGTERADAPRERTPAPLRLAVLAGRDVTATIRTVGRIADDLEAKLGRPVELLPMSSYEAMIDAQEQRRIDGGFYSAAAFALAEARCDCLDPLVAPRAADGTLAFHAVIVARSDSGIAALADLEGKSVAVGAPDSIGTRRMQLAGLMADGIDPAAFFGAVFEVGSPRRSVQLVRSGDVDAAFAWTSLSGKAGDGYSRGTLTDLAAGDEGGMDEIAVIWNSPPITHGPFALLTTVPEPDKKTIEDYLLTLERLNPAAYDMLDPFYGGGYAPVDPRDFDGLRLLTAYDIDSVPLRESSIGPASSEAAESPSPEGE